MNRPSPVRGRVSVVTVCFNAEAHISECIRSIRAQDYSDVEHIIIDGGSKDRTIGIIEEERGPASVVVSEADDGLYDAMNKGIERASGEFIALLNADDRYAAPDVLSRVVQAFARHDTDAVLGDVSYFDPTRGNRTTRRYDSSRFRPERISWGVMPAHPAMVLTAEAYRKVGRYRTDYRIAADFEFVLRAFLIKRLSYAYIPEVLVAMTQGGLSNRGLTSAMIVSAEMLRACRENDVRTNALKVWSRIPAKLIELVR